MVRTYLAGAVALVACLVTPAQAACWQQQEVEAAQIREFDIMLMVSALRCQVKGQDFVADYNAFVVSNRPVLVSVNDTLLRHFNTAQPGKAALAAYDSFGTTMANQFGNGGGMSEDCAELRAMAVAATASADAPSSRERLLGAAQRAGMEPGLPGGRCGLTYAALPERDR